MKLDRVLGFAAGVLKVWKGLATGFIVIMLLAYGLAALDWLVGDGKVAAGMLEWDVVLLLPAVWIVRFVLSSGLRVLQSVRSRTIDSPEGLKELDTLLKYLLISTAFDFGQFMLSWVGGKLPFKADPDAKGFLDSPFFSNLETLLLPTFGGFNALLLCLIIWTWAQTIREKLELRAELSEVV